MGSIRVVLLLAIVSVVTNAQPHQKSSQPDPQRMSQAMIAPLLEGTYRSAQGFKGTAHDPKLFHLGKDYCVDAWADAKGIVLKGTAFYAIAPGKVVEIRFSEPAYRRDGVGNYISIDHGNGVIAVYMHLAKVFVKPGQGVDANTLLGEGGDVILHPKPNCGHLHLEIRSDGVTTLNVPPNMLYSYASRNGTTRYSRPLGDERAVDAWIDLHFLDPERILKLRVSSQNEIARKVANSPAESWLGFLASFRAAVNRRDRVTLREMIAIPFETQEGKLGSVVEVFKVIDQEKWWGELQREVVPGAAFTDPTGRGIQRCARNGIFCFAFGADRRWRLFAQTENESR